MSAPVEIIGITCGCDECRASATPPVPFLPLASTLADRVGFLERALAAAERLLAERDRAALVTASQIAALESQLASESAAISSARLAAAHARLREVLGVVTRIGGYMTHEDQQRIRDARAEVA